MRLKETENIIAQDVYTDA